MSVEYETLPGAISELAARQLSIDQNRYPRSMALRAPSISELQSNPHVRLVSTNIDELKNFNSAENGLAQFAETLLDRSGVWFVAHREADAMAVVNSRDEQPTVSVGDSDYLYTIDNFARVKAKQLSDSCVPIVVRVDGLNEEFLWLHGKGIDTALANPGRTGQKPIYRRK